MVKVKAPSEPTARAARRSVWLPAALVIGLVTVVAIVLALVRTDATGWSRGFRIVRRRGMILLSGQ
jgi:hypothetical protein